MTIFVQSNALAKTKMNIKNYYQLEGIILLRFTNKHE